MDCLISVSNTEKLTTNGLGERIKNRFRPYQILSQMLYNKRNAENVCSILIDGNS